MPITLTLTNADALTRTVFYRRLVVARCNSAPTHYHNWQTDERSHLLAVCLAYRRAREPGNVKINQARLWHLRSVLQDLTPTA